MKTLTLELNPTEIVTLTELSNGNFDLFSGNIDLLESMAIETGWNFEENKETLANWAGRNKDLFVKEETEVSAKKLWEVEEEQILSSNFHNNGRNSKLSISIGSSEFSFNDGKSKTKRTMAANVLDSDLRELAAGTDLINKYFHKENGIYNYSNPKNK